jgi:dTDP-4-dehydrorhamnose 3,5-epimerase
MLLIEPRVFYDERGHFLESWNRRRYEEAGITSAFVQDNVSHSRRGVLRGLHLQTSDPQGKLVQALVGEVWDVGVDLRRDSPTFGQSFGCSVSATNRRQLWIPPGFAHGFLVLSEAAVVGYKCTAYYDPSVEQTLRWDDPDLAIAWPAEPTIISDKDRAGLRLRDLMSADDSERLPSDYLAT